MNITDDLIEDAKAVEVIAWEWYDEAGNVQLTHEEPPEIGATRITPLTAIQRQRERQAVPSGVNFGAIVDALEAISNDIRPEIEHLAKLIYAYADQITATPSLDTVKQDALDAARYRWLREQSRDPDADKPYCVITKEVLEHGKPARMVSYLKFDEALDKEIDAAMSDCPHPIVEELTK